MKHLSPTRNRARIALVALVISGLVAPRAAFADDDVARGMSFDEALEAAQAGRWDEARVIYEKLWNERRTYDVALLLGQAEYNLKRFRSAAEHLAHGLMSLPASGPVQIAERSRQILTLCKQEIGTLDLRVKNKGAEVLVDGVVVAEAPLVTEVFVEPGEHRFEVRLAGHTSESFTMTLAIGQTKERAVALKPVTLNASGARVDQNPQKAPPKPAPPAAAEPTETHSSWTPVIVGGIVTLVGASAGVGFELARQAADDRSATLLNDVRAANPTNPTPCDDQSRQSNTEQCDRLWNAIDDYDALGRMEIASFIVSGAALIGTGVYFVLARPDVSKQKADALFGPFHIRTSIAKRSGYLGIAASF